MRNLRDMSASFEKVEILAHFGRIIALSYVAVNHIRGLNAASIQSPSTDFRYGIVSGG
jgi:hypothetical protein